MKSGPYKITPQNLAPGSTLRNIMEVAQAHAQVEAEVMTCLPSHLRQHCRFVSFSDGTLSLATQSSIMATQLRFAQGEILAQLRTLEPFRFAWRLSVKVVPKRQQRRRRINRMHLSNENARLLKEEAGHTKDQGLQAILNKLARHGSD